MKRYNCCKIKTWLWHWPAEEHWEQAQRQEGLQACSNVCFTLGFANATNISYHNLMLVDVSWFHLKDVFYLIFKKRDVMPCRHGDPGGSVADGRTAPVLSWTLRRPELWAFAADLCWKIYPKVGNYRIKTHTNLISMGSVNRGITTWPFWVKLKLSFRENMVVWWLVEIISLVRYVCIAMGPVL